LRSQLGNKFSVLLRPPFILAGNVSPERLEQAFRDTIQPAYIAIAATYELAEFADPVTVIGCADEVTYRDLSARLFDLQTTSIYGYFRPTERTVVVNLATGDSAALTHELTHALIDNDCENIPLWLNEAIASMHESCVFKTDPIEILPKDNWRLAILEKAVKERSCPALVEMVDDAHFQTDPRGVNYAIARYFAIFLHERSVLPNLLAEINESERGSDNSTASLQLVIRYLGLPSLRALETEFQRWLSRRHEPSLEF
jgi:hypothetical protein